MSNVTTTGTGPAVKVTTPFQMGTETPQAISILSKVASAQAPKVARAVTCGAWKARHLRRNSMSNPAPSSSLSPSAVQSSTWCGHS